QTPVQRVKEVSVFEESRTRSKKCNSPIPIVFSLADRASNMPVLTRRMRKEAGLPDLPTRFPFDVPSISTGHPSTPDSPRRTKRRTDPMPRSTLPLRSPSVLSSPTRFDTPSTLLSSTSESPQRARSSTYSTASTATRTYDDLAAMHPGVQKLQQKPDDKWVFTRDGGSLRVCMPAHRGALFGKEWDGLNGTKTYHARSPSSDATIRGTPMPVAGPAKVRTGRKPGGPQR
ncbi:hypothetical protein B0H17DRAFT_1304672, partial [Mycena rosella]